MKDDGNIPQRLDDIGHEIGLCRVIVTDGYERFFELSVTGKANRRMAERAIKNIAEATRKLPDWWKQQRPGAPWREIAAVRNRITHDYGEINHVIVWEVIAKKLPELAQQLEIPVDPDPFGRL